MPGGDRTGPMAEGPMTGRGAGFCAGNDRPGYAEPGYAGFGRGRGLGLGFRVGRGAGGGRGFGRGFRSGYGRGFARVAGFRANAANYDAYPSPYYGDQPIDEKQYLRQAADNLKKDLADIEKRLKDIDNEE